MLIDLHTHSIASGHGTNKTITDLAKAAKERGLSVLGVSDHAPAMAGGAKESYFRSLKNAPRERFGVKVLLGAELNILDENGSVDLSEDTRLQLDYCIASLHSPIFSNNKGRTANTKAYIQAMKQPGVCIIGHPDDTQFPIFVPELVQAAKKYHVLLEISNSSLSPLGYRGDCLPIDTEILSCCAKYQTPVIIGSDSHGPKYLGEDTHARKLIQSVSFPEGLIANDHISILRDYLPNTRIPLS